MRSRIMTAVLIISLALNIGVASAVIFRHAAIRKMFRAGGPGFAMKRAPLDMLCRKMGISGEQKKEILRIHEESQKTIAPLAGRSHELRKELFRMIKEGKVDEAKKQKIILEISGLQAQIENASVDSIIKTRSCLKPEQAKRFNRIFNRMEMGLAAMPFFSDTGPHPHKPGPPPPRSR